MKWFELADPKKKCKRCGDVKPLKDFGICVTNRDGHRGSCRECLRKVDRLRPRNSKAGLGEYMGYQ